MKWYFKLTERKFNEKKLFSFFILSTQGGFFCKISRFLFFQRRPSAERRPIFFAPASRKLIRYIHENSVAIAKLPKSKLVKASSTILKKRCKKQTKFFNNHFLFKKRDFCSFIFKRLMLFTNFFKINPIILDMFYQLLMYFQTAPSPSCCCR